MRTQAFFEIFQMTILLEEIRLLPYTMQAKPSPEGKNSQKLTKSL